MKVSLFEVHNSADALRALSNQVLTLDVSITVSQILAVFETQSKAIDKALIDKATLMGFKLGSQVGDPPSLIKPVETDEGESFVVPAELVQQFDDEATNYLKSNFVLVPVAKLTKKQLLDSKAQVTPAMLRKLEWLFADLYVKTEETATKEEKRRNRPRLVKHG